MSESASKLESMAGKIQQLLKMAESLENEQASANYRAKAEELMRKYRIEEEHLIAGNQFSVLPVTRKIVIATTKFEFYGRHATMWYLTAKHCGVRASTDYVQAGDSYDLVATVVGYESDIRYAEFLHNSARLAMISKLEPVVNREKSDADNVYALRSAGLERNRISKLIWGEATHSNNAKVTRLYEKACAERGEVPAVSGRSVTADVYRTVYAQTFVSHYEARLRAARNAVDSINGALDLHGRKERVDEAFYDLFPQYRPETEEARAARLEAESADDDSKGKISRRKAWTKADETRYHRMTSSPAALAGSEAGRAAAEDVQIKRGHTPAQRVEAGEPIKLSGLELGN